MYKKVGLLLFISTLHITLFTDVCMFLVVVEKVVVLASCLDRVSVSSRHPHQLLKHLKTSMLASKQEAVI